MNPATLTRSLSAAGPGARTGALACGIVAAAAVLLVIHLRLHAYCYDDAYIHFRVVKHLLEGGTPYFNTSEPIKVSSSSAWTLLLAALAVVCAWLPYRPELPAVVAVWNALATLAGACVFSALLLRLVRPRWRSAVPAAFFVAYLALMMRPSIGLMETPTALVLVGAGLYLRQRNRTAGFVLLGVAAFFRIELAVVWLLVALHGWSSGRFTLRQVLLPTAAAVGPLAIYDLYFFGTLIPHAVHAKRFVYQLGAARSATMALFGFVPEVRVLGVRLAHEMDIALPVFLVVVVLGLTFYAVARIGVGDESGLTPTILLSGGAILAAYVLAGAFVFAWYVPLYAVPVTLATALVIAGCPFRPLAYVMALLVSPIVVLQILSLLQVGYAACVDVTRYQDFAPGARVRHYRQVGQELAQRYPSARLLAPEIGALGYAFGGYILDGEGLASPAALRYHPMKVPTERIDEMFAAVPPGFVEESDPEIIVAYDVFIDAFEHSPIAERYVHLTRPLFLPDDMARDPLAVLWWSTKLNIFVRKDLSNQLGDATAEVPPARRP